MIWANADLSFAICILTKQLPLLNWWKPKKTDTDKLDSLRDFFEKSVKRAKLRLELGLGVADAWVDKAKQEQEEWWTAAHRTGVRKTKP